MDTKSQTHLTTHTHDQNDVNKQPLCYKTTTLYSMIECENRNVESHQMLRVCTQVYKVVMLAASVTLLKIFTVKMCMTLIMISRMNQGQM